jgi:DNA modification methylase
MTLHHGDCLEVLRTMPDNSVDSIVTDPPYGLSFMGKKWDYDVPSEDIWRECLRVLKPGGHLLAFAGTRTQHRMAVRIEDAGFEIRDMIAWCYGSGFPKSLDVSKAIDKAAGAVREVVGRHKASIPNITPRPSDGARFSNGDDNITAPATEAAKQWEGWGTALKPALEPITVARKPLGEKTVAANVLAHGTGGINVDGCRVGTEEITIRGGAGGCVAPWKLTQINAQRVGRFPANFIHDGSDEVVGLFPAARSNGNKTNDKSGHQDSYVGGQLKNKVLSSCYSDSGSAARFFYCAKASKKDRDEGCEGLPVRNNMRVNAPRESEDEKTAERNRNHHPTVKPTALMRYLCRLVTPPEGIVLDPFMGSGSTGKAAMLEGFLFIGIERDADYLEIAKARIKQPDQPNQPELFQP